MVIGGSRDLPNALWFSKSGTFFDFDEGEGLDDEAIVFRLAANDDQAIRALVSASNRPLIKSAGRDRLVEWRRAGAADGVGSTGSCAAGAADRLA
jgi:hypothetical protein